MKIEIPDEIAKKCDVDAHQALELLAVALYKHKGIHGSLAAKLLGITEFEFRKVLSRVGETSNYDVDDLVQDIKNHDL